MNSILIFRTSADATMKKLIHELGEQEIDCLIQSSQVRKYQAEYPYINFIDIYQESFYDLSSAVTDSIVSRKYDEVYVTFSGMNGHNYGNIVELLSKIDFKKAFFYNCNGEKVEIPKNHILKDAICRLYIKWIDFSYGLRRD